MGRLHGNRCWAEACKLWSCCPTWAQVLVLFVAGNIIGDVLAFPFVHSFWNLVGFEGWFANE